MALCSSWHMGQLLFCGQALGRGGVGMGRSLETKKSLLRQQVKGRTGTGDRDCGRRCQRGL